MMDNRKAKRGWPKTNAAMLANQQSKSMPCPQCAGTGKIPDTRHKGKRKRTKACITCRGTGVTSAGYLVKGAS